MKIARLFYPVKVLGPGLRVGIWTAGCHRRCKGCANPELWDSDNLPDMTVRQVMDAIKLASDKGEVTGITISGGEPLDQSDDLSELIDMIVTELGIEDIILFTGHDLKKCDEFAWVSEKVGLAVDGQYDELRNRGEVLRGSDNQNYIYKNDYFRRYYEEYIKENDGKFLAQNFNVSDGVVSVGIHKPDFADTLDVRLKEKGIWRKDNE